VGRKKVGEDIGDQGGEDRKKETEKEGCRAEPKGRGKKIIREEEKLHRAA